LLEAKEHHKERARVASDSRREKKETKATGGSLTSFDKEERA